MMARHKANWTITKEANLLRGISCPRGKVVTIKKPWHQMLLIRVTIELLTGRGFHFQLLQVRTSRRRLHIRISTVIFPRHKIFSTFGLEEVFNLWGPNQLLVWF